MAFNRRSGDAPRQEANPREFTRAWSTGPLRRSEGNGQPGNYRPLKAGRPDDDQDDYGYDDGYDDDYGYDDGLDDLSGEEEEEEELTEEELRERKISRIRLFFGAGNLVGTIAGAVLILVLIALLLSMVNFVMTDMNRNFVLFQTNF